MHLAVGATAATTTTTSYSSTCFAQLLSLQLAGNDIPLDAGRDCGSPGDSFFPTDTIAGPAQFPFVVNVLYENTSRSADQSSARARTGVAHVFLPFSAFGGPDVTLDVLTSESTCKNGNAEGSSHVIGLQIGDNKVELPGDITGDTIDQLEPLALVELNKASDSSSSSDSGATSNPRTQTTTDNHSQTALHVVVLTEDPTGQGIPAPLVDLTVAHTSVSCSKTTTTTTTGGGGGDAKTGWMNGGGTMVDDARTTVDPGTKVSHGFVLPCFKDQAPPPGGTNLTVNGDFGHFKLDTVDSVKCTDDPNQGDPENPKAGFNTMDGTGTGTCDGLPAKVQWHFTDEGEPNTADEATIHIQSTPNTCHVDVVGILTNGNNQAHPLPTTGGSNSTKGKASAKH